MHSTFASLQNLFFIDSKDIYDGWLNESSVATQGVKVYDQCLLMNLFLLSGTHHSPTFLYAALLLAFVGIFFVSWITSYCGICCLGLYVLWVSSYYSIWVPSISPSFVWSDVSGHCPYLPSEFITVFWHLHYPLRFISVNFPHIRRGISSGQKKI